jgi:hypothetical protein
MRKAKAPITILRSLISTWDAGQHPAELKSIVQKARKTLSEEDPSIALLRELSKIRGVGTLPKQFQSILTAAKAAIEAAATQPTASTAAAVLGAIGGSASGPCKARPSAIARKAVLTRWKKPRLEMNASRFDGQPIEWAVKVRRQVVASGTAKSEVEAQAQAKPHLDKEMTKWAKETQQP